MSLGKVSVSFRYKLTVDFSVGIAVGVGGEGGEGGSSTFPTQFMSTDAHF